MRRSPRRGRWSWSGTCCDSTQSDVWNRITERAADLAIVAAASDRPKLYGEFARRALQRRGAFAELLPLAADPAEFGIDPGRAAADPALVDKVRDASGVFFVGGAPQRLARVLFRADGSPTALGRAVGDLHAAGGVVVGGIPGSAGLFTGVDAMEALASGAVSSTQIHRGLELVSNEWFVDQHVFSPGRLAEILVAMHQIGMAHGIGIGTDTAAVIEGSELEVVGDGGVLLIDLSASRAASGSPDGFRLAVARLSYLEHGDRLDLSTLEVTPTAEKLDGFEIEFGGESDQPAEQDPPVAVDFFARGQLLRLMREAVDGARGESFGYAFPEGVGAGDRWLSLSLPLHARDEGMALRRVGHGALHHRERRSGDFPCRTQGHAGLMRPPQRSFALARAGDARAGRPGACAGPGAAVERGGQPSGTMDFLAGRLSSPSGALRPVRIVHPSRMTCPCGRCRRSVCRSDLKRSVT